jgi:7-cyano-7-deazaguanine synthase in queuosine biosynthesis
MYNLTTDVGCPSLEAILDDARRGVRSMLIISGGLDSAYIMWKYAQVSDTILCHHIKLGANISKRVETELISVRRQVEYLRQRGKTVELLISETHTADSFPPARDWYATVILSLNYAVMRGVRHIVVGDDLPDSYDRAQSYSVLPTQYAAEIEALNRFVRVYSRDKCDICTAHEANNLGELYSEMPEDFRQLIFSCREPVYQNEARIEACGKCTSCMKNRHFGWWDRISKCIVEIRP